MHPAAFSWHYSIPVELFAFLDRLSVHVVLSRAALVRPAQRSTLRPHVNSIRLEFSSVFEMLDLVQVVSDGFSRLAGLDEDALHWIGVAVRESVINAIKHGNRNNAAKHVFVEFSLAEEQGAARQELRVVVRDQGNGFNPEEIRDPLAPENVLSSSGRGIFFMRSFMDNVVIRRLPEGGMEVRMVKRIERSSLPRAEGL